MEAIIDVVLPVFAIILAGWVCGRAGLLGDGASEALNGFVYFAALPALFFGAMATVPLAWIFNLRFVLDYLGATLGVALVTFVIVGRIFPAKADALGLQNMSALFSNTGYMGIPLLLTAFGNWAKLPAIIATVLNGAIVMACYIALVEFSQSRADHRGKVLFDAAKGVVKSPLVLAAALGIAWSGFGLAVPPFLAKFCEILGSAAPPAALFAMGLFMVGKSFRGDWGEIGLLTGCKLLLHPLLAWAMLLLVPLGFGWDKALLILAALPTGSLVFSPADTGSIPRARPASSWFRPWSRW
jgi:predicted permease